MSGLDPHALRWRLRHLRANRGLTVEGMAVLCDMPQPTIETILYGPTLPGAEALYKLSVGLKVSVDWILTGGGDSA